MTGLPFFGAAVAGNGTHPGLHGFPEGLYRDPDFRATHRAAKADLPGPAANRSVSNLRYPDPVPTEHELAGNRNLAGRPTRAKLPQCAGADLTDVQRPFLPRGYMTSKKRNKKSYIMKELSENIT